MAKVPTGYTLEPLPDEYGFGPEDKAIQDAAQPQTVQRIAAIIRQFDGGNETALAQRICNMIFEGEPLGEG